MKENLLIAMAIAFAIACPQVGNADESELSVSAHVAQVEFVKSDPQPGENIPVLNPSNEAIGGAAPKLALALSAQPNQGPVCNYQDGEVILLSATQSESKCKYRYEYSDHADNETEGMLVKTNFFSCRDAQGNQSPVKLLKTITHYLRLPETGVPFCDAGVR